METRLLEYFLTVAREKNITRSAELLHITQPTLSRQLVSLEEEFGQQLIIRGKRGIQLTEAGMLFRRRAEEILDLVSKTEREMTNELEQLIGQISIGSAESSASYHFLPNIIHSFSSQYPLVTYDFYTGEANLVKEKLNQGILDIGILLEPIDIEEFDFIRLPYQDSWGLIVDQFHPIANKETLIPKDLIGIPLFFNERRTIIKNELESWAKGCYEEYQFIASYNLISNIIAILKNEMGGAIAIEGALTKRYHSDMRFIPFSPALVSNTVLVWKKHQVLTPIMKRFLDLVHQLIEQ